MDWTEELVSKRKRHNQILFAKDSLFLQDLSAMIENQSHKTLILWSLELAEDGVERLREKYPWETRPSEALSAAAAWSTGAVKMRFAQRKILDCHAFAKELDDREHIALCHAVGQTCSVVHTPKHALGYPLYDLSAAFWRSEAENYAKELIERKKYYMDRLAYWIEHTEDERRPWADFIK